MHTLSKFTHDRRMATVPICEKSSLRLVLLTSAFREGANDILTEYHQKIGGKPVRREPVRRIRDEAFLNGPQSGGRRSRKSNSATGTPTAPEHRVDAWKPPAGSWEEHIQAIDTIEHDKRGLHVYVQWNDGRKSRHPTESIYKHAPQKVSVTIQTETNGK